MYTCVHTCLDDWVGSMSEKEQKEYMIKQAREHAKLIFGDIKVIVKEK